MDLLRNIISIKNKNIKELKNEKLNIKNNVNYTNSTKEKLIKKINKLIEELNYQVSQLLKNEERE